MDRKDFFSRGIKDLTRKAYRTPPGQWLDKNLQAMSNLLSPAWGFGLSAEKPSDPEPGSTRNAGLPRPPGALPPKQFLEACTACGDCIAACPYGAVFVLPDVHGPVLDPNHIACHLCEDYPCIEACPEDALSPLDEGVLPGFGVAEVYAEACLNSDRKKGQKRCRECLHHCPVEDVIRYDRQGLPEIEKNCTGCGVCVENCPTGALKVAWGTPDPLQ